MKIAIIVVIILMSFNSFSQDKFLRNLDSVEVKAMRKYIDYAFHNYKFYGNKGIVILHDVTRGDSIKTWQASIQLADEYKTHLPERYAYFEADVILFYEEKNHKSNEKMDVAQLDSIIQDRVFITPPRQKSNIVLRWGPQISDKPILGKNGELRYLNHHIRGMTDGNNYKTIRFDVFGNTTMY